MTQASGASRNDHQTQMADLARRLGLRSLSEMRRFPKYFEIETTNLCQARCEMCTIEDWTRKKGVMSDELFEKVAVELGRHADWIEKVAVFRDGEPLLDKKIEKRIKRLKDLGIRRVGFSTNAGILTAARSKALLEAGIDEIMFSIDGFTKETFEEIRRRLVYEEVRDNTLEFIRQRDAGGYSTRVCVRMVLQEKNQSEHEAWLNFWNSKVKPTDEVYAKGLHTWGNQLDGFSAENQLNYTAPCISPFSTMVVHVDGTVPLCGVDFDAKINLGNVNQNSMEEIWRAGPFEKIRELHSAGSRNEISFCIGCRIWDPENRISDKAEALPVSPKGPQRQEMVFEI